jgi:hypothetical protein
MLQEAIRSGDVPASLPDTASTAGRIGPADADAVGIGRLSQQLNMSVFYVPSMRDGAASEKYSPADRGNAILSTVRLSEPSAIELPGDGQRRVAVTATVPVTVGRDSAPLSIVAAHLSTRGRREPCGSLARPGSVASRRARWPTRCRRTARSFLARISTAGWVDPASRPRAI